MTTSITLKQYVQSDAVRDRIKEMLDKRAPQFIVSLLSTVNSNDALQKCEPASVLNAAMTAASLDLPINQNLGFAYIIPYNSKVKKIVNGKEVWETVTKAQFQMGYKGFIQLAQRSGSFRTINVTDVREGEIESNDRLTGEIKFKWADAREKLKVIGYIGYIELVNGFRKSLYMTVEELKAHGTRYSQNFKKYNSGLWAEDFDAMASKTVIKLLLSKYAPMTTEMQTAQIADQGIVREDGEVEYPDNTPITAEQVAKQKETDRIKTHIAKCNTTEELESCQEAMLDLKDDQLKKLYDDKYDQLNKVS